MNNIYDYNKNEIKRLNYFHKINNRRNFADLYNMYPKFDYTSMLTEYAAKYESRKNRRYTKWFEMNNPESMFNQFRIYMQDYIHFSIFFPYFFIGSRIRYHASQKLLAFYDSGKRIAAAEEPLEKEFKAENEKTKLIQRLEKFEEKAYNFIREKIIYFIALSEKEKTVWLLKQFGIKVLFAQKGCSWITRPDIWVLTDNTDFERINSFFLKQPASFCPTVLIKNLIFWIIGIPVYEINAKVNTFAKIDFSGLEKISMLCFFAGFAKRKILIRRFFKSNGGGYTNDVVYKINLNYMVDLKITLRQPSVSSWDCRRMNICYNAIKRGYNSKEKAYTQSELFTKIYKFKV